MKSFKIKLTDFEDNLINDYMEKAHLSEEELALIGQIIIDGKNR